MRIPALLASANLPVCVRAGRQAEFLGSPWRPPGGGRGDRCAARAPRGAARGAPGRPRKPNMTKNRLVDRGLAGAKHLFCVSLTVTGIASAFEHLMHQFPHSTRVTMAPPLTGQTAISGRPSRLHRLDAWPEGAGAAVLSICFSPTCTSRCPPCSPAPSPIPLGAVADMEKCTSPTTLKHMRKRHPMIRTSGDLVRPAQTLGEVQCITLSDKVIRSHDGHHRCNRVDLREAPQG